MARRIRLLLIILSFSLNAAVLGVWAMRSIPREISPAMLPCAADSACRIDCPLHRAIGTTEAQWRVLGPLQQQFRSTSRESCVEIDRLRGDMMGFLALSAVPRDSVLDRQERILVLQRRMQELTVDHLLAEKQVLTANQWASLLTMMERSGSCVSHAGLVGSGMGIDRCDARLSQNPTRK